MAIPIPAGAASAPAQPTPHSLACDNLANAISDLERGIDMLRSRLEPALSAEPPEGAQQNTAAGNPGNSPVTTWVSHKAEHVRLLCDRLASIIGRLEI